MVALSDRIIRVRAPNPSPMTLTGTNTYLVRTARDLALVVDPGPALESHIDAIVATAEEWQLQIDTILVTHGHPDHAPGAELLSRRTAAPVLAHQVARFPVDRRLQDDERIEFDYTTIAVVNAPGHAVDHLVFALEQERTLFTGDVVLGSGTVVVAPPGGAMRPYQTTLKRLLREYGDSRAILGGHGEAVTDPHAKLTEYIAHREMREAQVLLRLSQSAATIPELVQTIYANIERVLWPAAARQMLAHLLALEEEERVVPEVLPRAPTPEEAAILDPNLGRIADPAAAEVARAELGIDVQLPLVQYRLA